MTVCCNNDSNIVKPITYIQLVINSTVSGCTYNLPLFQSTDPNDSRVSITYLIINNSGDIVASYNKCHLFDIDIPGQLTLRESDFATPGKQIVSPVDTPVGKVGMAIVSFS